MTIDVSRLRAIDTHVHVELDDHGHTSLPEVLTDAATAYFGAAPGRPTIDELADLYRGLDMAAVVFTVDAHTELGHPSISSDDVIAGAARHPDVLIPFASVDPNDGDTAIASAHRLAAAGARGFKFHPSLQGFDPSDPAFRPLWAELETIGLPVIVHTGQTGIGAGLPGGHGIRLGLSRPILLDEVAAAFPRLTIVMAHPSFPWQDEALAIATHKPNVWIDLSGWSPKYFPDNLVRYARTLLQDRVLFGSDYPLIHPTRWLDDFAKLGFDDAVTRKITLTNAIRLLGLGD